MTLNNPLANALSKIMNREKVRRDDCTIFPVNTVIKRTLEIMNDYRYIGSYTENKDAKGESVTVSLLGNLNKCNAISPTFAVKKDQFEKFEERYLPAKNVGLIIVSTPQGIMTHQEAKKRGIGGKLLAYCY